MPSCGRRGCFAPLPCPPARPCTSSFSVRLCLRTAFQNPAMSDRSAPQSSSSGGSLQIRRRSRHRPFARNSTPGGRMNALHPRSLRGMPAGGPSIPDIRITETEHNNRFRPEEVQRSHRRKYPCGSLHNDALVKTSAPLCKVPKIGRSAWPAKPRPGGGRAKRPSASENRAFSSGFHLHTLGFRSGHFRFMRGFDPAKEKA